MPKHRLLIDLSEFDLKKIDTWALKHQYKRKKAIEILVLKGLNAERFGVQLDLSTELGDRQGQ